MKIGFFKLDLVSNPLENEPAIAFSSEKPELVIAYKEQLHILNTAIILALAKGWVEVESLSTVFKRIIDNKTQYYTDDQEVILISFEPSQSSGDFKLYITQSLFPYYCAIMKTLQSEL